MGEREDVRFREVQRFYRDYRRGRYKVMVVCGVMMVLLGGGMLAWGAVDSVVHVLDIVLPVGYAMCGVLYVLLGWLQRGETEVRGDGLYLRDFPFSSREIGLENVVGVETRRYDPDRYNPTRSEYGKSGEGKGYFLYGKEGVRIDYADGSHVLIGSGRAEELAEGIRKLLEDKGHLT